MTTNRCPDPELLLSLACGDPDTPDLETHIKDCDACRTEVDRLRADVAGLRKGTSQRQTVSLTPGSKVGYGYSLTRQLGKGGFGEVWEATGPGAMRVALKIVHLDHPGSAKALGEKEKQSLDVIKNARHINLLAISAYWEIQSLLVIAMELAERTLLHRFEECQQHGLGGIPAEELRVYLKDAAEAIDFLNFDCQPPIQHRDIKPANLLLMAGRVKVGDYGLAKFMDKKVEIHSGAKTFAFAAPEIFRNEMTQFSDQYSLAATYCKLLGGRLPFEGSEAVVMAGHLHDSPDLSMLPAAERDVVARALAKKPEERWPSCKAFVKALNEVPAKPATPVTATPPSFFDRPTEIPSQSAPLQTTVKNIRPAVVGSLSAVLAPLFMIESVGHYAKFGHFVGAKEVVARPGILIGLCFIILALMGLLAAWRRTAYYYGGLLCTLTVFLWTPAAFLMNDDTFLRVLITGLTALCLAMLYHLTTRTVTDCVSPRSPARWPVRALVLGVLLLPMFAVAFLPYWAEPQFFVPSSVCSIVVNGLYLILPAARRNRTHWLPVSFAVAPSLLAITYLVGYSLDTKHHAGSAPTFNNFIQNNVQEPYATERSDKMQGVYLGQFVIDGKPRYVIYIFDTGGRFRQKTLNEHGEVEYVSDGQWQWNDTHRDVQIKWDSGGFEVASVRWNDDGTMEYHIDKNQSDPSQVGQTVKFKRF